ncbi:IS21 family transposase [Ochrobactrum soli]|uniref:Mobile element protein n=1 Tax=Ochrobactrum soli TaxID=2448455 RepID=A0A2P9HN13_9HYPH|nr:IS21 family transposase [[Ochrobactrum] soli]SPL62510.1 Mobile element protein [[Ochrobactrum] soli]SPL65497.1 Mobile element protein [[Ochrobactrum] soli]
MRQVREILKLRLDVGLSTRVIAKRLGIGETSVRDTVKRLHKEGLTWPLPDTISDSELEQRLYRSTAVKAVRRKQVEPDWSVVARELKRKHVTLQVLWEEYIASHPDGYRYSRYCDLFRDWQGRLPVVMRQSYVGGEKLFVDYAGDKVGIVDRKTGAVRDAHIFVAVMGASSLSFALATWSEQLPDWIEAHNAAYRFFGGVTQLLVSDNTKCAVIKACHFDPMVNRSYTDMARHYGTALLPARPRKPRDKAKVENCVGIVERWLFGRLRKRTFYSLADLNEAILDLITRLNDQRVIRQYGKTRRALFAELDMPNLKPLPGEAWVHAQWRRCRVGIDYHIELHKHFYSVPYRFARSEVEVRYTIRTVEIFLRGERIAVHMRGSGNGRHTTITAHMPPNHQRYKEWTPSKIRGEASRIGPMLRILVDQIIKSRAHPEQGYRACVGIIGLERRFGADRLDAAAQRALEFQVLNYPGIKSILEKELDRIPRSDQSGQEPIQHANLRGSAYYH